MPDLTQMPSQDPALASFYDDVGESGHREAVDNTERGCGFLQTNAAYVRSDVQALSSVQGEIPRFVELEPPIEYREHSGRGAILPGYKPFPGTEFLLAYDAEGYDTRPSEDVFDHIDRMQRYGLQGDHYYAIKAARAHDILMSVGETHWGEPDDFIRECRNLGLNLKIPAGKNNEPPVVLPFRTRCFVIHPNGYDDGKAGIIGYAYLTRTIYTAGEDATQDDPKVPGYASEWSNNGLVDVVDRGEAIPEEESSGGSAALSDFAGRVGDAVTHEDVDDVDDAIDEASKTLDAIEARDAPVDDVGDEDDQSPTEDDEARVVVARGDDKATHVFPAGTGHKSYCGLNFDDDIVDTSDDVFTDHLTGLTSSEFVAEFEQTCGTCLSVLKREQDNAN